MARSLLLAAALIAVVSGQATTPFFNSSFCFQYDAIGEITTFIADSNNTCVYWECLELFGFIDLEPRHCPLGTAVSKYFGSSSFNPCTEYFNAGGLRYDCTRENIDLIGNPPCLQEDTQQGPGGIPRTDFCREAGDPCQNGGSCTNQCLDYVCTCVSPFNAGSNCEIFNCTNHLECLNGGTCSGGPQGTNQFASCECLPGYTGVMCEIESEYSE